MRRTCGAEPLAPEGDAGGLLDGPPCQKIHPAEDDMPYGNAIHDIGPRTAAMLRMQLKTAGTTVRNGPVGIFEFESFGHGTAVLSRAIEDRPAFNIAGGGNTLTAICRNGMEDRIGTISTDGGAFHDVREGKTPPTFEILQNRTAG
jgi:phosphoglycerate kinase